MPVGPHTRRLTINLPSDVAEDLACRAAADGRSLSGYIVRLLCRPSPAAVDDPLPLVPPLSHRSRVCRVAPGSTPDVARRIAMRRRQVLVSYVVAAEFERVTRTAGTSWAPGARGWWRTRWAGSPSWCTSGTAT